jgi:hypothetical protein
MAVKFRATDHTALSSNERRQLIAAILGRGVHRALAACMHAPGSCESTLGSTEQKALDVSAPGDPHVSCVGRQLQ